MTWKPTPPPARPRLTREEKRERTRQALREAAQALFAAKGLEATTVDDIVAAAGYTRGAFYANYRSQIDLMKELIASGFDGDLDALAPFADASTPEEYARAYQEYSARFERDPGSLMWVMEFQMAAMRYPELREEYIRQYARMVDGVAELAESALPAGIPKRRAAAIVEALVVLQPALATQRILAPDRVPEEIYQVVFAALLRGVDATGG